MDIITQICRAIEHVHDHQILHADLKPSNTLITPDGRVKIIDFNIVHHLQQHIDSNQISAYSRQFASPEQINNQPLSPRSDIYSIGKILEYLTNQLPSCNDIDQVIQKATSPKSSERYSSVELLLGDIGNIRQSRPISVRHHEKCYRLCRVIQRHPTSMALSLLCLITSLSLALSVADKQQQLQLEEQIALELTNKLKQSLYDKLPSEDDITHDVISHFVERVDSSDLIPHRIKQAVLDDMLQPYPDVEE